MSGRVTYLYKAEMKTAKDGDVLHTAYFYSRNGDLVRKFCEDNYKSLIRYSYIELTKVGESKYTIKEPVVEFNEDETKQIEQYFLRETIKYVYFQQKYGIESAENL